VEPWFQLNCTEEHRKKLRRALGWLCNSSPHPKIWTLPGLPFDSGTNTATWEAGVLESSNAAIPGTLIRDVIPFEKSFGSKNWTSFVANRHAEDSSGQKRIDGHEALVMDFW
jgi:hypothetical protein